MNPWSVIVDDPRRDDVIALLERHLLFARAVTPPEDVHALDLDGLLDSSVTFFSVRDGATLVGIGAIKQLDSTHMEVKSVHTAEEARGNGVASAIVDKLVSTAREHGAHRVSLETGSMDEFAPSRALYRRLGFVECGPFGDYSPSPSSIFMTLELS